MLDLDEIAERIAGAVEAAGTAQPHAARPGRETSDDDVSCEPPLLKILVVEDDAGDFALIERCLRYMARYEPQIVLAGNMEAARFAISSDEFDLVLLDYGMHGESGIELLVDLARINNGCPSILLSSLLTADIEREAVVLGVAACIAKGDLSEKLLEAMVHQVLRGQAVQRTQHMLARAGLMQPALARNQLRREARPETRRNSAVPGEAASAAVGDEVFDVQELVVEATHGARRTRAGVRIDAFLHDVPVYVRGDRQATKRKLANALDRAPRGQVVVKIERAGVWNEIVVEPGLPDRAAPLGDLLNDDVDDGGVVISGSAVRTSILLLAAERSRSGS